MRHFGKSGYENMRKDKNYQDLTTLDLKHKHIMITGANAGLGFAASLWFATQGSTSACSGWAISPRKTLSAPAALLSAPVFCGPVS